MPPSSCRNSALNVLDSLSTKSFIQWFSGIDHFLFDCDGVIWNGERGLIPGAKELLIQLRRHGRSFSFMTNSASATRRGYASKFRRLLGNGSISFEPPITEDDIMCTAFATALRLQRTIGVQSPYAKDVYVIGTAGLVEEIENAGFVAHGLEDSASKPGGKWTGTLSSADMLPPKRVGAVVVGIDRDVSYTKMTKAVIYLRRDPTCKFFATNRDIVVPINDQLCSSNGMVVAGVAFSAGREVDEVVGKPSTTMIDLLDETMGLDRQRTLMVGDNLDTDILFGIAGGTQTLLVLSGVSTEKEARAREPPEQPGAIADSVGVIAQRLKKIDAKIK